MEFNSAAWYMQSRGIEHVRPAAHANNIAYTPADLSTLDDSWQNKESRLDHLQPFGCHVVTIAIPACDTSAHNCRIWGTKSNSVITSRDVVFTSLDNK